MAPRRTRRQLSDGPAAPRLTANSLIAHSLAPHSGCAHVPLFRLPHNAAYTACNNSNAEHSHHVHVHAANASAIRPCLTLPHSTRSRNAGSTKRAGVRPSDPSMTAAAACGRFAAERRASSRYRSTAAGTQQQRRRSTAFSSKCGQCRVDSGGTRLNTDFFQCVGNLAVSFRNHERCVRVERALKIRSNETHTHRNAFPTPQFLLILYGVLTPVTDKLKVIYKEHDKCRKYLPL